MGIYTQIAVTHSTDTASNECSTPPFIYIILKKIQEFKLFSRTLCLFSIQDPYTGAFHCPSKEKKFILNYLNRNNLMQLPGLSGSEGTAT